MGYELNLKISMSNSLILSCSKVITTHNLESKQPISVHSPHRGLINCAIFNHTNKVIASAGQDGRIVLVSAEDKEKVLVELPFEGNNAYSSSHSSVNTCLFSPHSKYIAAGSVDGLVKVWAMSNHKEVYLTLQSHNDSITSLAWTKNEEILVSSSIGGTIFLHSVKTGKPVEEITLQPQDAITSVRLSEGSDYSRLAATTETGGIRVWDLDASRKCRLISSFENVNRVAVTSLSFSPFHPVLMVTSSVDENLTFYDISSKKAVQTIATEQPLTTVTFLSDGQTLLAGGMYGGLYAYDLRKPQKPREKFTGHETAIKFIDVQKERESQYHSKDQGSRQKVAKGPAASSVGKIPRQKQKLINKEEPLVKRQERKSSSKLLPPRQPPSVAYAPISKGPQLAKDAIQNYQQQTDFSRQMPYALESLRIKLQNSIADKFQLLHLEIIRQFQIQQEEIKCMLNDTSGEAKRKDEKIKELQEDIARMKRNRY